MFLFKHISGTHIFLNICLTLLLASHLCLVSCYSSSTACRSSTANDSRRFGTGPASWSHASAICCSSTRRSSFYYAFVLIWLSVESSLSSSLLCTYRRCSVHELKSLSEWWRAEIKRASYFLRCRGKVVIEIDRHCNGGLRQQSPVGVFMCYNGYGEY